MPPPIVENLLWLYTEPGEIVVDLAIRRETLRSVWTVSKLRTHRAVTLTIIGPRVLVGEEIAGAKWAVKRANLKPPRQSFCTCMGAAGGPLGALSPGFVE